MFKQRFLWLAAGIVSVTTASVFTSCSSDNEFFEELQSVEPAQTRAAHSGETVTITFENDEFDSDLLANPTSWGRNYYENTQGFSQVTGIFDDSANFVSQVNSNVWPPNTPERTSFIFGGIALSDWAITSNPLTNPNQGQPFGTDWWYSEYNQMSVYNTSRIATGNRGGAGAGGSDNFAVVYGIEDTYSGTTKKASFEFPYGPVTLKSMKICNTAYTYGVIQNGNVWYGENGVVVIADSLTNGGYLDLIILCYDENDMLVKRVETPLADYRNGRTICLTTWSPITINAENVCKVVFDFWGSDVGAGGLKTPAYVAIDDIEFEYLLIY